MVLMDYSKAFDMVDHQLLLQKLEIYGVKNREHLWFQSYLSNRKQMVSSSGKESDLASLNHGVPQGSILGRYFLYYLSTICHAFYVTDTSLCWRHHSYVFCGLQVHGTVGKTLNTSVAEIQHWAEANKRPLNDEKTKVLMVTSKRLASRLDEQHTIVINGDTQLTHNVVTKLLERCSLVRSDLTFRRHSHDVRRSFGLSQRCHNVVWSMNVASATLFPGADTTLSQRFMNVASATLCPVPTQRCHNVAWTSRVQRYVLVLTQCCHNVVWTAL